MTCAWTDTSRAETGSSQTMSLGERHGAGDPDALALAAGELVGVPVVVLGVQPHAGHDVLDRSLDPTGRVHALDLEGCAHDRPTVWGGFSDE